MSHRYLVASLIALAALGAGRTAFGHSEHGTLYVAPSGSDTSDCRNASKPCKTLLYALARAGKGEQVRIAAGTYEFDRSEAPLLVSVMVDVQGGYSAEDGFKTRDVEANQTFVVGPSFEFRSRLAERGLTLVQDQKSLGLEERVGDVAEVREAVRQAACVNGFAGEFPCRGIDLLHWMPLDAFSTRPSAANDIWGFVDRNDNREYAIIGLRNGTAVVDVTDPEAPREVGTIPGPNTTWRDIKVSQSFDPVARRWKAYAYAVADAVNQGLQIIDLTKLPDSISLAAVYNEFASAHNIYMSNINYQNGVALPGLKPYVYILGSNRNGGAFRTLDITDPVHPVEVTPPPARTQYVHDATSIVLRGPRAQQCAPGHQPCEIYVDFNENTVDIWDITDKSAPVMLSSTGYAGSAYTHSGWWSADKRYIFIHDELDESSFGVNTQVRTLDITDLRAPFVSNTWVGPTPAIDHNGFAKGKRYYISNYRRGLTVLDISNPNAPSERAFFDTYPSNDNTFFNGAWGVYPFLPSGTIVVSDIERGLFVLREQ